MAIGLDEMKNALVLIALIAMVGGATALALTSFQADLTVDSVAYNTTQNGLVGVDNTTGQLGTIGTVFGVAVLIGIVILAFSFARR